MTGIKVTFFYFRLSNTLMKFGWNLGHKYHKFTQIQNTVCEQFAKWNFLPFSHLRHFKGQILCSSNNQIFKIISSGLIEQNGIFFKLLF
jgi:hypothetical protein